MKEIRYEIRMTNEEKCTYSEKAARCGLNLAVWIRQTLNGTVGEVQKAATPTPERATAPKVQPIVPEPTQILPGAPYSRAVARGLHLEASVEAVKQCLGVNAPASRSPQPTHSLPTPAPEIPTDAVRTPTGRLIRCPYCRGSRGGYTGESQEWQDCPRCEGKGKVAI